MLGDNWKKKHGFTLTWTFLCVAGCLFHTIPNTIAALSNRHWLCASACPLLCSPSTCQGARSALTPGAPSTKNCSLKIGLICFWEMFIACRDIYKHTRQQSNKVSTNEGDICTRREGRRGWEAQHAGVIAQMKHYFNCPKMRLIFFLNSTPVRRELFYEKNRRKMVLVSGMCGKAFKHTRMEQNPVST